MGARQGRGHAGRMTLMLSLLFYFLTNRDFIPDSHML